MLIDQLVGREIGDPGLMCYLPLYLTSSNYRLWLVRDRFVLGLHSDIVRVENMSDSISVWFAEPTVA